MQQVSLLNYQVFLRDIFDLKFKIEVKTCTFRCFSSSFFLTFLYLCPLFPGVFYPLFPPGGAGVLRFLSLK